MPIFDKLSKRVGDAAKTATKKSGDILEITKLNRSISTEEDKIDRLFIEIGKTIYQKYGASEDLDPQLADICRQIAAVNSGIEGMKARVLLLKNIRTCPHCGAETDEGARFCPKCGTKIEVSAEEAAEATEKPSEEPAGSDTSEKE